MSKETRLELKRKTTEEELREIFGDKFIGFGMSEERIDIDVKGDIAVDEEQKVLEKFQHYKKHKTIPRPKREET
jgi:hypothetical protein